MQYFQKFSEELSKVSGISSTPISLFVYSILAIVILSLLEKTCRKGNISERK